MSDAARQCPSFGGRRSTALVLALLGAALWPRISVQAQPVAVDARSNPSTGDTDMQDEAPDAEEQPTALAPAPSETASMSAVAAPSPTAACNPQLHADPAAPVRVVPVGDVPAMLHVWAPSAEGKPSGWLRLCAPPCAFAPPDGPRRYGLSGTWPGARIREAGRLWVAPGDGIEASLRDRRRVRATGAGLLALSLIPLVITALVDDVYKGTLPAFGVTASSGLVMLLVRDRARVRRCIGCARR